jgi:myo-inositol catabolism protein IolC
VLVRYNPESDEAMNCRQAARLRELADYTDKSGLRFMFELLVPMTHEQSGRLEGDQHLYDHHLRPSLMIAAVKELQNVGVEPDVSNLRSSRRSRPSLARSSRSRHPYFHDECLRAKPSPRRL